MQFAHDIESILQKDSLDLTDPDRTLIRGRVAADASERVVITHGTDTMVQTPSVQRPVLGHRASGPVLNPKTYCDSADWMQQHLGLSKAWQADLLQINGMELLGGSLAAGTEARWRKLRVAQAWSGCWPQIRLRLLRPPSLCAWPGAVAPGKQQCHCGIGTGWASGLPGRARRWSWAASAHLATPLRCEVRASGLRIEAIYLASYFRVGGGYSRNLAEMLGDCLVNLPGHPTRYV